MSKIRAIALAPLCALLFAGNGAAADVEAGRIKSQECAGCHGTNGNATSGSFPILAGQTLAYIYFQLQDFKVGRRTDANMSVVAGNLSDDEMMSLAMFFSSQVPTATSYALDQQRVALGAAKAQEDTCTACHQAGLLGLNLMPKLAGQQPDYLRKQLTDFRNKIRTNDGGTMQNIAGEFSDDDITNLAHYIASLPPVAPAPSQPAAQAAARAVAVAAPAAQMTAPAPSAQMTPMMPY